MEATLGPAVARLDRTFPSVGAYVDFFRAHPAFAEAWTEEAEEYVRYDASGPEGAVRSRVRREPVREDGRWLLTEGRRSAPRCARSPLLSLLRAPRGLLNQPVGLMPDELAATWAGRLPALEDEVIDDCNHYTILFDDRCASLVAGHLSR